MSVTISIQNYRAIQHLRFSPKKVSILIGANGSGKTTLLNALSFMRNTFNNGFADALNFDGGSFSFKNHFSSDQEVFFNISSNDLSWEFFPNVHSGGVVLPVKERIIVNQKLYAERANTSTHNDDAGEPKIVKTSENISILKHLQNIEQADDLKELIDLISNYTHYHNYHLWSLRKNGSLASSDTKLQYSGQNAFSVLRNWFTSRPHKEKYDFVIRSMRSAFPNTFEDLDFEGTGQTVSIRIFGPNSQEPISAFFVSNGLLIGLLHLMAICSTNKGGLISIDEPENGLHPFAATKLLEAIEEWAEDAEATVLLATHSPYIMNQYKEKEDQVFVLDTGAAPHQIQSLSQSFNMGWLRQFSLGDLYGLDFAKQKK